MSNQRLIRRILLGIVVIALVVAVALYAVRFFHSQQQASSGISAPQLFFGNALTGPLYGVSISKSNQQPQIAEVSGIPHGSLIDLAKGKNKTFYLEESPDKKHTNIVYTDNADSKHVLHDGNRSPEWKFQLSYDEPSNTLAYASVLLSSSTDASASLEPKISVLNTYTNTVKDIGYGSNPVVLPGGEFILIRQKGSLSVIDSAKGNTTKLLSIATSSPFAVSPDAHTVTLYNPIAKTLDTFDMRSITSASYLSSIPVSGIPIGLSYVHDKLLVATVPNSKSSVISISYAGEKSVIASFSAPFANILQLLNFTYE